MRVFDGRLQTVKKLIQEKITLKTMMVNISYISYADDQPPKSSKQLNMQCQPSYILKKGIIKNIKRKYNLVLRYTRVSLESCCPL